MRTCKMRKSAALTALLTLLMGCDPYDDPRRGEARIRIFTECMELAAKMPRQSDDDVAHIVDSCGDTAYYQSNTLTFREMK